MNETTFTNPAGIRFYVEQAADFDDEGRPTAGRGWFAGIINGNCHESGVWFEDRQHAVEAAMNYGG